MACKAFCGVHPACPSAPAHPPLSLSCCSRATLSFFLLRRHQAHVCFRPLAVAVPSVYSIVPSKYHPVGSFSHLCQMPLSQRSSPNALSNTVLHSLTWPLFLYIVAAASWKKKKKVNMLSIWKSRYLCIYLLSFSTFRMSAPLEHRASLCCVIVS